VRVARDDEVDVVLLEQRNPLQRQRVSARNGIILPIGVTYPLANKLLARVALLRVPQLCERRQMQKHNAAPTR